MAELEARGALVVEWRHWRGEASAWLRSSSSGRQSLNPPARERIDALFAHDAVAVLGVQGASLDDVRCLHDTLLVPVLGAGVPLLVECSQEPEELDFDQYIDPGFERPHPLERMLWLCFVWPRLLRVSALSPAARYPIGGWQALIERFEERARALGVRTRPGRARPRSRARRSSSPPSCRTPHGYWARAICLGERQGALPRHRTRAPPRRRLHRRRPRRG